MNYLKKLLQSLFGLFLLLSAISCDKEEPIRTTPSKLAQVEIEFQLFNGDTLINPSAPVVNLPNGSIVRIQDLAFYLSNFSLSKKNGEKLTEKESYHLIRLSRNAATQSIVWDSIPEGDYTSLNFFFGVDSIANSSTDQVGDLDIQNNMAWNWATGYKFLLLEASYQQGNAPRKAIVWHLGFNEIYSAIRSPQNALFRELSFKNGERKKLVIKVDIKQLFKNITIIDDSTIMTKGPLNTQVAENFINSFSARF